MGASGGRDSNPGSNGWDPSALPLSSLSPITGSIDETQINSLGYTDKLTGVQVNSPGVQMNSQGYR